MSLLKRYVAAVKRHLPAHMRDDVGRELDSSLADALDALESASGQPLSDAQIAAVLKRRGHPLQVAASYHSDRALIGACTFPLYVRVLRAGLALVGGAVFAQLLLGSAGMPGVNDVWHLLHDFYWSALALFAWLTIAFFLLDGWIARGNYFQRWEPSRLRPVPARELPISGFDAGAEIVIAALVLTFLEGGLTIGGRWFHVDAPLTVGLASSASAVVPFVTAAFVVVVGMAMMGYVERYWTRSRLVPVIAAHALIGVCLGVLAVQPDGVALLAGGAGVAQAHADSLLYTVRFFVLLAALRSLFIAALGVRRFRLLSWSDERPVAQ